MAAARRAGTPSVVRLRHQPHELRNDTRALRWPWFSNQKAAIVDGERGTEAAEPHLLRKREFATANDGVLGFLSIFVR
eukprot:COSAG06_NODE_38382_length_424_cov_0.984615_2_plen_77_part_01